jgi:hypothetical protein
MPTEQKPAQGMQVPVSRGMITWKDVFNLYESGEITADIASKFLREIREQEMKDLELKLKDNA